MPRAQLVTIYWRDIPAQVNAQSGRTRHQIPLRRRFQRAIDRAAMVAGITTADEYVREWRRVSRPCGSDLEAEATAEAARVDAEYPRDRLDALATNGGIEPS
jgi:Virulence factor